MQAPAKVGGQLLGFGPGQQHAVIQRMQKMPLGDPAAFLHQFLVHNGDLPGRAPEADATQLEPIAQGFGEGGMGGFRGWVVGH